MNKIPSHARRRARGRHIVAPLASLAALPLVAASQALVPAIAIADLETVVVSAARVEETLATNKRPVAVIDKSLIEQRQSASVPELMQWEAGVSAAGGPRAATQSVNIRGVEENRVLQVVDGVPQSFSSGHRPSYLLDPELLQRVEIIKGPTSSLWGSGAIGGVVSQQTVSPSGLLAPDQSIGGYVKLGYNDNNDRQSASAAVAGHGDAIDWLLNGYYRDSDDIELGNGETLESSASEDQGAMAKIEWEIDEVNQLAASVREGHSEGEVPSNASAAPSRSNFVIERESTQRNATVNYRFDPASERVNGQLLIFRDEVDVEESRVSDGRFDRTELNVNGVNLNNVSVLGKTSWLYGVDLRDETFSAKRGGSNRPTPPDAENQLWGSFVQATVPLVAALTADVGARYDDFETEASNLEQSRSDNEWSPSAALSWQPNKQWLVGLRHDRAFRAPGAEELYSTGTHFCMRPGFCNTFVPNPDLESETAANTELLGKWLLDDLAGEGELLLQASLYENHIDDFIEQIVTPPSFFPVRNAGSTYWSNVENARIRGYEVQADYQRSHWGARLAYASSRGEDRDSGEDLSGIPADRLTVDLSRKWLDQQLTTGVRVANYWEQDQTDVPGTAGETYDGYTLADVYASYEPVQLPALSVDLSINNLSDRYYRQAWDELYRPGREAIASIRYRF